LFLEEEKDHFTSKDILRITSAVNFKTSPKEGTIPCTQVRKILGEEAAKKLFLLVGSEPRYLCIPERTRK